MAKIRDLTSSFEFGMIKQFLGYNSESDKTNTDYRNFVRGSVNVYKKRSGTIANRQGQKRYDPADTTLAKVDSEFVWNTSWGATLIVRVCNSKLQVYYGGTWISLLTGLTKTRYVFDTWWNNTEKKDRLLFVNGTSSLFHWSGGIVLLGSGNATSISLIGNSASLTSFSIANSNSASLTSSQNNLVGSSLQATLALLTQPTNGDTLTLTINGTAIGIQFVSVIGAVAGNVLIGANLAATRTNLLGLLNAPGTTNANQVALSGPNQTLVGYLTAAATNSLIKQDLTTSWAQNGFASATGGEKSVKINSNTYVYSGGENGTILYGVTGDPSAEATGSSVVQTVQTATNTPASGFSSDWIKVLNNRAFVGSYSSRNVFLSSNTDFTNYSIPGTIIPGSPNLIILDQFSKGMGIRNGNAHIGSGTDSWFMVSFSNITVGSVLNEVMTVTKLPMAPLIAPLGHEFIETVSNNLIYLSQDQQLRTFGDFKNLFVPAYPSLSINLYTELFEENFTGGHVRGIGEFVYITAPASGKVYLHQSRQTVNMNGNITTEKIWHSPFIWNLTRIEDVNGTVYGFSNANPQMYQLWDTNQWHDDSPSLENLPYTSILAMAYYNSRRQGLIGFDKVFTEGYIGPGTPLNLIINYDYQGSTNILQQIINSVAKPAKFYIASNAPSIGDDSIGDDPIGDGLNLFNDHQDSIPKFRCINTPTVINVFEYQLNVISEALDSQWELLAIGTDAQISDQQATFIINK